MWRCALIVLLVGCSHPARSPHGGDGTGTATPDAAPVATPDATPAAAPVTEADCDALIDHVLDIMMKADNTPEDRSKAHESLRGEFLPQCLQLDRDGFDCMMQAPDQATFGRCGEP